MPPNVAAELKRDVARLGFVVSQIKQIEKARQRRLEQQPESGPHAMVRLLARVLGIGIETADMLVHEVLSRRMRDSRAVAPMPASRVRRTKVALADGNKGLPEPARPGPPRVKSVG